MASSGPRAKFRATDLTLLAAGGLLSLGGYPETGPVAVPGEQGHLAAAIFGAVATLTALLEREGTNHGQWVDVSGQECIAFALEDAVPEWYLNRTIRRRTGDKAREAGTGVYPCMDGHVSMVAGRLGTAKAFKTLVHWIADSGTRGARNCWKSGGRTSSIARARKGSTGSKRSSRPSAPPEASRSSTSKARRARSRSRRSIRSPTWSRTSSCAPTTISGRWTIATLHATVTFPGPPYRLAKTPAGVRTPAATTGEHNHTIYVGELGMNEDQLRALEVAGVV